MVVNRMVVEMVLERGQERHDVVVKGLKEIALSGKGGFEDISVAYERFCDDGNVDRLTAALATIESRDAYDDSSRDNQQHINIDPTKSPQVISHQAGEYLNASHFRTSVNDVAPPDPQRSPADIADILARFQTDDRFQPTLPAHVPIHRTPQRTSHRGPASPSSPPQQSAFPHAASYIAFNQPAPPPRAHENTSTVSALQAAPPQAPSALRLDTRLSPDNNYSRLDALNAPPPRQNIAFLPPSRASIHVTPSADSALHQLPLHLRPSALNGRDDPDFIPALSRFEASPPRPTSLNLHAPPRHDTDRYNLQNHATVHREPVAHPHPALPADQSGASDYWMPAGNAPPDHASLHSHHLAHVERAAPGLSAVPAPPPRHAGHGLQLATGPSALAPPSSSAADAMHAYSQIEPYRRPQHTQEGAPHVRGGHAERGAGLRGRDLADPGRGGVNGEPQQLPPYLDSAHGESGPNRRSVGAHPESPGGRRRNRDMLAEAIDETARNVTSLFSFLTGTSPPSSPSIAPQSGPRSARTPAQSAGGPIWSTARSPSQPQHLPPQSPQHPVPTRPSPPPIAPASPPAARGIGEQSLRVTPPSSFGSPTRIGSGPASGTSVGLRQPQSRGREPKVDLVVSWSQQQGQEQGGGLRREGARGRVEVTASLRERIEELRRRLYDEAHTAPDQAETDFEDMLVKVRRGAQIVDDTLEVMFEWTEARWRQGVVVHFEGELGIDCGALTREWAKLLCQQLLRPGRGLFRRTGRGNRVVMLADEESELAHGGQTEEIYAFVGRFIAFSLWRGIRIDAVLTHFMFRLMMDPRARATHEDLREVDPKLHANLQMMLQCEPAMIEDTFCQTFCLDTEFLGVRSTFELCENGADIPVTGDNVREFVDLYVQHRCELRRMVRRRRDVGAAGQVLYILSVRANRAFLKGFHSLIPPEKLPRFTPVELEAVICGQPSVSDADVEELRLASHCSLDDSGRPHPQVLWFWDIMRSLPEETRSMVLQFVTGNERPPLTGFQALEHPFTVQVGEHLGGGGLPQAHVCFNQLVLPPASSMHELHTKLLTAVSEGREGFEMH